MAISNSEAERAAMHTLGVRHATLEAEGDLDGTMDTLVDEPVYEFWPAGRRMVGRDAVRRYYRHLIDHFMPSQIGYEMVAETLSTEALSQEYVIELEGPEGPERHRVLGILVRDEAHPDRLSGERIWGDEAFLRRMVGPIWDELDGIDA
jgi:hypothetical protein